MAFKFFWQTKSDRDWVDVKKIKLEKTVSSQKTPKKTPWSSSSQSSVSKSSEINPPHEVPVSTKIIQTHTPSTSYGELSILGILLATSVVLRWRKK